jgi:hypothetical protein
MKLIITIALIISTTFCFGQMAQNTGSNLENDFSKSKLGAENVEAFEARAKQKVEDFCNYIQLVSNKGFDEKFRQHSLKSALGLFNSEQCVINDSIVTGKDSMVTIAHFLDAVLETKFHQIEGQASQIALEDDLKLTDNGNYAGTICYVQTLTCYNKDGKVLETVIENKTVGVTLNRKTKSFGTTEKIIWVVQLCDIQNK